MTPMAYLVQELGLSELRKLSSADRDQLKQWATEEMHARGITVQAQ